jgi:hypothetical protein
VIHTATHDCGMWEPRCAPGTPGSVVRVVELRAGELLGVSKRRDVERKGVVVVFGKCRGERRRTGDVVARLEFGWRQPKPQASCS